MSDKLTEIMAWKRREIASVLRPVFPEELAKLDAALPKPPSFAQALRRPDGRLAVISEIKRRSPSAGAIAAGADGVVVGSALIDALRQSLDQEGRATAGTVKAVAGLVTELAAGVRGRRVAAE